MKFFIPYILFGALFAGVIDKNSVIDCNEHIGIKNILILSATYPILIIVAIISDPIKKPEGDKSCGEFK